METSSQERLEEIKSLCENCRKVVVDDSWIRDNGYKYYESPTDYFLIDRFPILPELEASSRHGCSFCGYLREMISSTRAKDFLERHYGISTTDADTREIQITISFRWTSSLRNSLCLCAKINLNHAKSDLILWSDVRTVEGMAPLLYFQPLYSVPKSCIRIHGYCKTVQDPLYIGFITYTL